MHIHKFLKISNYNTNKYFILHKYFNFQKLYTSNKKIIVHILLFRKELFFDRMTIFLQDVLCYRQLHKNRDMTEIEANSLIDIFLANRIVN